MMLSGYDLFKRAFITVGAILLLLAFTQQAGANSFASLDMFGFPATMGSGSSSSGVSDITSNNGALSATSVSSSPSNQFMGYFGSGWDGVQLGVSFAFPTASHDASTVAYARNVAFEAIQGDDAISFPDINVDLGSPLSSFPTINSANSDIKYMESVQFQLSTESDTMPMSGFSFPGFFGSFL